MTAHALAMSPPERAGGLPADYRLWLRSAEDLLSPLVELMQPGAAGLPIEGPASNHGLAADRLESFARPCLLAAHWLAAEPDPAMHGGLSKEDVAKWFREGLLAGTSPDGDEAWGPTTTHHQHTVEMGALVLALEMASEWLWEPFEEVERLQIARWLSSVRGSGFHRNNHLFFGILPLSFLLKHGCGIASDHVCVRQWMTVLESMALGRGWFIDGMNESIDHYNAYAFHYYGLWWGRLYGELDAARAERWKAWTHEFLKDYAHFFAASGEPVPFGRSMTYRFAASAPFALAELCGASPLAPGQARRLCTRNLRFFLDQSIEQSQGVLSIGWVDEFPAMAEAYSCGGSPYWAAKGFAPLLLPSSSPFWEDEQQPLPCETADFSRPIPEIGMVIRGDLGDVELINGSTGISGGNTAFGAYKWGKLSYRTGIGFEVRPKDCAYPLDASLSAKAPDGTIHARQYTHSIEVSADHSGCMYVLGERFSQFNVQVESHLWWRGGWQLHVHRFIAHQPARLILGSYSLAAPEPEQLREEGVFPFVRGQNRDRAVALQALCGFEESGRRRTIAGESSRVHLFAPNSLSLYLQTQPVRGEGVLVALTWTGRADNNLHPWVLAESEAGSLALTNPDGDRWEIQHSFLPLIQTNNL